MKKMPPVKLTWADRIRGWFDADYAARATVARYVQDYPRVAFSNFLSANERRGDTGGWQGQPWGPYGTETLTPERRRSMVKRARQIDENNMLGSSLLDRAVDNIIGWGFTLQSTSKDKGWRSEIEAVWREYEMSGMDARGMMLGDELQRAWYRSRLRDGDIGILLLRNGAVQTIEADFIETPYGGRGGRTNEDPEIIDGVEVNGIGRPLAYHVASLTERAATSTRIPNINMIWYPRLERNTKRIVRGVPLMAQLGPLLDQIDGTVEAVVMAHRMAACFGLIHKRGNPAAAYGSIAATTANMDGREQKSVNIEPAMYEIAGHDDEFIQVKPEHPHTGFGDFMTFLIRLAGLKLGLPLELAMLDFSRTNYSSARASMEQAYRHFKIEQAIFAQRVMRRLFQWRISKWINDGTLSNAPDDAWEHKWFAPEWPYLDPQKDAEGALVAVDAGFSTLSKELGRRGLEFNDWLEQRTVEIQAITDAGLPIARSNKTRDANASANEQGNSDGETQD